MRYYIRFVMFVNGLLVTAGAVLSLLWAYPPPGLNLAPNLIEILGLRPYAPSLALGGTLLLIGNVVALSRRVFGAYRAKDIPLLEGDGEVRVKTAAIEGLLARIGKSNPIVTDAKVRVFSQMIGRYRIVCAVCLLDSPELHKAVEQVRARLRQRFLEIFPRAGAVSVDVHIVEVLRDNQRSAPIEDAYPGPQYPVGDEFPLPTARPTRKP